MISMLHRQRFGPGRAPGSPQLPLTPYANEYVTVSETLQILPIVMSSPALISRVEPLVHEVPIEYI